VSQTEKMAGDLNTSAVLFGFWYYEPREIRYGEGMYLCLPHIST